MGNNPLSYNPQAPLPGRYVATIMTTYRDDRGIYIIYDIATANTPDGPQLLTLILVAISCSSASTSPVVARCWSACAMLLVLDLSTT